MANNRFGSYVFVGADENKNLHFKDFRFEAEEAPEDLLPHFFLDVSTIDEELNYQALFPSAEENPSEEVTNKVTETINGFFKTALKNQLKKVSKLTTSYPKTGESYISKPVFYHYALANNYSDNSAFGGMTLAIMYQPEIESYIIGIAFCNKKDLYMKKLGNQVSWDHLKYSPIIITKSDVEEKYILESKGLNEKGLSISIDDPVLFIRDLTNRKVLNMIETISRTLMDVSKDTVRMLEENNYTPRSQLY